MALPRSAEVTGLLRAWSGGDQAALDRLAALVYDELHRIARHYMQDERTGNTLQTTGRPEKRRLAAARSVLCHHRADDAPDTGGRGAGPRFAQAGGEERSR
jgi:hypothetical protein